MIATRWCPLHDMPYSDACPLAHECEYWWVVDLELAMGHDNWLIAVVEGFRVRWATWYEDTYKPIAFRTPEGMTAAQVKASLLTKRESDKRKHAADRRARWRARHKCHAIPSEDNLFP